MTPTTPIRNRCARRSRASRAGLAARLAALGEMRELGDSSAALHAGSPDRSSQRTSRRAVLSGGEMKHLAAELQSSQVHPHRTLSGPDEASQVVKSRLQPGDATLTKGSNASGMAASWRGAPEMSEGVAIKPQKAGGATDAVHELLALMRATSTCSRSSLRAALALATGRSDDDRRPPG